ncbi:hypothetical protein DID88_004252 [Monilinia fructigena]|uniref:Uncharacterized protein n=1 Tax=Monilinia fructigena TaxID=38457 RepID=A0A395IUS8_9HELO|nr:hypothetical protein DID88_004252 [Monilinia fructigena]
MPPQPPPPPPIPTKSPTPEPDEEMEPTQEEVNEILALGDRTKPVPQAFKHLKQIKPPQDIDEPDEIEEYFPALSPSPSPSPPPPPPPPAPPALTKEEKKKLKSSSRRDRVKLEGPEVLPGAFQESVYDDEIIDIVEMPIQKKDKNRPKRAHADTLSPLIVLLNTQFQILMILVNPLQYPQKAAKMFGLGIPSKLSRSKSEKTRPSRDDDVDDDVAGPIRHRSRSDKKKQGDPSENLGAPRPKQTDSSTRKSGLGGMFGGVFGKKDKEKDRPDLKRRSTAPAGDESRAYRRDERKTRRSSRDVDPEIDVTMTGAATEEDQEARRAARRARRAEREAGQKGVEDVRTAKEESRRDRQQREEEDEQQGRREKLHRHMASYELKILCVLGADEAIEMVKMMKLVDEDVKTERNHLILENQAAKSAPVPEPEFLPADGPVYSRSKPKAPAWPHSGTDSWVRENSDAPPPPNIPTGEASPVDDTVGGEAERKRMRKTRPMGNDDDKRRRREERRREKETEKPTRSPEGSQEDAIRGGQRDSGFETSRAPGASGGLFGRWKRYGGF